MNYSYEILNAEPQHKFLSVRYFAEGRDNFFKNFNPEDWSSAEALVEIIENFAPYVIAHWTYQESAETSSPIAIGDINTSSAEALTEIIYTTADMPEFNNMTHWPQRNDEPDSNNVYQWTLHERTLEDKAAIAREIRNEKIQHTDYLAMSDQTLSTEMAAYRQALRDVPEQEGFPTNIVWPTKPA